MTVPATARRGGPARRRPRADRDGDLLMQPISSKVTKRQNTPPQHGHSGPLVELKVSGWKNDGKNLKNLLNFLERHAARRASKKEDTNLIKKSRVDGDDLIIRVRKDHTFAFNRINGFVFSGEKLTITGQGIRDKSPLDGGSESTPNPARETLKNVLSRRYNSELKLLDLSILSNEQELQQIGMFESESRQSKFFPALMKVCDEQFKSAAEKRDTIVSVSLANNSLNNISIVTTLAQTLPQVLNLDLSGNNFKNTKDLIGWKNKFPRLDLLVLDNNPILTEQPGWEQQIIQWFPRLRSLNGVQVRTDEQVARLDRPKQTPNPLPTPVWQDVDGVAEKFILDFFPGFDNDRDATILKYYDNTSIFSFSVNAAAKGGAKQHARTPWDAYIKQSRNIKFIHSAKTRASRKHRGPVQIQKVWAQLPPTRHPSFQTDMTRYSIDCQRQPGLPDPTGQTPDVMGLMVTIHGEFEEHHTKRGANEVVRRCFDRTFILGPGGQTGVKVVSDMWCLRASGGVAAWIPQDVNGGTANNVPTTTQPVVTNGNGINPQQEQLIVELSKATGMNLNFSRQCLESAAWDPSTAMKKFEENKANLGPEAFS